jgi:hypothetical protein
MSGNDELPGFGAASTDGEFYRLTTAGTATDVGVALGIAIDSLINRAAGKEDA